MQCLLQCQCQPLAGRIHKWCRRKRLATPQSLRPVRLQLLNEQRAVLQVGHADMGEYVVHARPVRRTVAFFSRIPCQQHLAVSQAAFAPQRQHAVKRVTVEDAAPSADHLRFVQTTAQCGAQIVDTLFGGGFCIQYRQDSFLPRCVTDSLPPAVTQYQAVVRQKGKIMRGVCRMLFIQAVQHWPDVRGNRVPAKTAPPVMPILAGGKRGNNPAVIRSFHE